MLIYKIIYNITIKGGDSLNKKKILKHAWWILLLMALATFLLVTGIDPIAEISNLSEKTKHGLIIGATSLALGFVYIKK